MSLGPPTWSASHIAKQEGQKMNLFRQGLGWPTWPPSYVADSLTLTETKKVTFVPLWYVQIKEIAEVGSGE